MDFQRELGKEKIGKETQVAVFQLSRWSHQSGDLDIFFLVGGGSISMDIFRVIIQISTPQIINLSRVPCCILCFSVEFYLLAYRM